MAVAAVVVAVVVVVDVVVAADICPAVVHLARLLQHSDSRSTNLTAAATAATAAAVCGTEQVSKQVVIVLSSAIATTLQRAT